MQPPDPTNEKPGTAGTGRAGFANHTSKFNGNAAAVQPPSIELVLGRLERVRKAGAGYTARCPAHEDRNASLSITVGHDGRILAYCFAGCSIHDVVGAIGLSIGDLFAQRLQDASPEQRKELQGLALKGRLRAAANVLDHESGVALIAAGDLGQDRKLTEADHDRLALACERIHAARAAIGGIR